MNPKWHSLEISEIFSLLKTSHKGLSRTDAENILREEGPNKLPEAKVDSTLSIFLRQFASPLIYILILASMAVLYMGDTADAVIIFVVLLFNAVVGSVQEGKAQNTLRALSNFIETKAFVMRDGEEIIILDHQVVRGDIIVLQEGEKIPADARIIDSHNLKVDEATLTGESEAVTKIADVLEDKDIPSLEQKNMIFKGTNIVSGSGLAVVVEVGLDTVIGRIAKEVSAIDTDVPLKANIRNLSRLIILTTSVIGIILFGFGIVSGKSAEEMFSTVVSIAVSVIPEGLPIAMTLILATGVWRMGKRNALVKRLQAVEALGQAQVIAVDKTGTITKNEMVIQAIYTNNKLFEVTGVGYEPQGTITLGGQLASTSTHPELYFAGKIATFCANARTMLLPETNTWRVAGDPTEAAMYVLGQKLGFNKDELEQEFPLSTELPFDYRLKYHATIHGKETHERIMTVVGAPEVILELCDKIRHEGDERPFSSGEVEFLETKLLELSRQGLRVLAFATSREIPEDLDREQIRSLTFGGFFGMKDALRPEVREATKRAQDAGIRVVMITGDYKTTAETLAREALIYKEGDTVLSGQEIDKMSDFELREVLSKTSVFARVTPEHKLRIINAYKARGEVVAMTGDGINDAPSLVAADLGVAMGKIGTEVAKEASDIILLDDNFDSIIGAVEEGRSIYKTIRKVVLYLLSTSLGEVLVISTAIFLSLPLPLLPAQIIWLNLITDGFLTVALAMEPKEEGLLKRPLEKSKKYLVDRAMSKRMLIMSLAMAVGTLILFNEYYPTDLAKAWTISLTLLAVYQWFNAWNCRSDVKSVFSENLFANKFLVGATLVAVGFQMLAVYHPLFQRFLRTVPLSVTEWIVITTFGLLIILVEEIRKFFARRNPTDFAIVTDRGEVKSVTI